VNFDWKEKLINTLNNEWFDFNKRSSHRSEVHNFGGFLEDFGFTFEFSRNDNLLIDYETDDGLETAEVSFEELKTKDEVLGLVNRLLVETDGEVTHATGVKPKYEVVDADLEFLDYVEYENPKSSKDVDYDL